MNKLLAALWLALNLSTSLFAQQLPLFTQYRENMGALNPASINGDFFTNSNNLSFGASYRNQWSGFDGAPTTQMVRGEYFNSGGYNNVSMLTGGYLINDQTGPTGFTGLYGRIGGVISDDTEYRGIGAAISLGAVQYRVNGNDLTFREDNDLLINGRQAQIAPDAGFGVFGYTTLENNFSNDDMLYGGISVPQLIGLDLSLSGENREFFTRRVQHVYAHVGLYHFFKREGFIEPSLWVKYAPNAPVNVDLNLRYQMAENFWLGLGGSTASNVHIETGVLLGQNLGYDNMLKIGYGFDYSFKTFGPQTGITHELNLSFSLPR